jgi:hypothetical protein
VPDLVLRRREVHSHHPRNEAKANPATGHLPTSNRSPDPPPAGRSAALGHSTAATTLNLYSHMWPGDEDRIRDAVDLALTPRTEDQLSTKGEQ